MPDVITIIDIVQTEWTALRDHLSQTGWALSKGGGLDHSWATLQQGEWVIEMAYDRWDDGEISYAREQAQQIEAVLPASVKALRRLG